MTEPVEPDDAGLVPWHTVESAEAAWGDASGVEELAVLLLACKMACWTFVPATTRAREVPEDWADVDTPPALVPARYRIAQLRQAQNVVRTVPGDQGASLGLDGYAPRVYVFGYDVRTILLPPTAGPAFF